MKQLLIMYACIALTACGGSGGTGGKLPEPTVPGETGGAEDDDTGEGKDGFYIGLFDFNDKPIPVTKLPSILEDGKLVDLCREGQTIHLDQCYDGLHLSDRPGFRLTGPGGEVVEAGDLSEAWQASFSSIEEEGTGVTLKHRQTYKCKDWCSELPTFYGSYGGRGTVLADKHESGLRLGSSTTLFTFFSFGGLPGKPEHVWLANGSLTLNGKTLRLPATRREIRSILPDFHDDRARTMAGSLLFFRWEDETFGLKDIPANEDDQRLISITFEETGDENVQLDPN